MIEINELEIEQFPKGKVTFAWVHIINNGLGVPIRIPIVVARGNREGKILGLTAAVHGNELNGIQVIQKFISDIKPDEIEGSIVGIYCLNVPGFLRGTRQFTDGMDLNRIAPGNPMGDQSAIYMYRILDRVIYKFDYLIDLHTASFGRKNSYYIRADMDDPISSRMAKLQGPDIILHNPASDSSLRGSAALKGINSITIELRDPNLFQFDVIDDAVRGIKNICYDLEFLPGKPTCPVNETILCDSSYWRYTDEGGILHIFPKIKDIIKEGQKIAEVRTVFDQLVKEFFSRNDGIVIGRSTNPVNQTGSRIIHLGLNPRSIPCEL